MICTRRSLIYQMVSLIVWNLILIIIKLVHLWTCGIRRRFLFLIMLKKIFFLPHLVLDLPWSMCLARVWQLMSFLQNYRYLVACLRRPLFIGILVKRAGRGFCKIYRKEYLWLIYRLMRKLYFLRDHPICKGSCWIYPTVTCS